MESVTTVAVFALAPEEAKVTLTPGTGLPSALVTVARKEAEPPTTFGLGVTIERLVSTAEESVTVAVAVCVLSI